MPSWLDLADYRRRVSDSYADVRSGGAGEDVWLRWRAARDELFRSHPQSALTPQARHSFEGLNYFPYDPAWRVVAEVEPAGDGQLAISHSAEGSTRFVKFGRVPVADSHLAIYWLDAYGGGIFVPFRDETSGRTTYGGGRYLLDTVKGADLGQDGGKLVLDFNYAYQPSCAYNPFWSCPLAPPENRLPFPVEAGERFVDLG